MASCDLSIAKQLNFLNNLSKKEKQRLHANSSSKKIKKGTVIFAEDDLLQSLFCIREGACKFSILDDRGKEVVTDFLGKGDLMGRRSLITKKGAMVTATAITDTTLCCVDSESLLKGLSKNNTFCLDMIKGFAEDEEEKHLKMGLYENQRSIKKRLAGLLIYLKKKFGSEQDGSLIVPLKRQDMANVLGTSSEYVITLLASFKKQGLIGLAPSKILILSEKELLKIV
ncbi:Crp/Fnr family transcriptional regulator [Maribacter chungangensis]|uniref:Crp/Fnr family transcriptional regulator n=1 Tax=Maribacter chungangensis TaxID=1069117 RepID=A0ABW3B0P2_9FLAO